MRRSSACDSPIIPVSLAGQLLIHIYTYLSSLSQRGLLTITINSKDHPYFNGYFPHRWGILLFTPPPGSRARRLGWSQYMHECVGASPGYYGVVGGLGLAVGWLVGSWRWGKYGYLPHRCGVPVAAPRQDRLGCTIDPMIALRRTNTLMHVL